MLFPPAFVINPQWLISFQIRFISMDETEAESIKDNLLRTLGTSV